MSGKISSILYNSPNQAIGLGHNAGSALCRAGFGFDFLDLILK